MALEVRRIVTGHDARGKAVIKTDERLPAVSRLGRPHVAGCEIWSTEKMPTILRLPTRLSAKLHHHPLQLCWDRAGDGHPDHRIRPRRTQIHAPHRDGRVRPAAVG